MSRFRWIALAAGVAAVLAVSVAALPAILPALLPYLLFRPLPLAPAEANPARWGLTQAQEIRFRTEDGVRLHGWWIPAAGNPACATVVLFHGRSANITTRAAAASWLAGLGYHVLSFDYRGYGASDEAPISEVGLYRDGAAAYRYATTTLGVPAERIVLLGQSMGTAVAADVAARDPAAALVLVSPYTSAPGVVRRRLPSWLPEGWPDWQRNRFDVKAKVIRLRVPLIVAASRADEQVPYAESLELFRAAPEPKHWVDVDDLPHNGLLQSAALQQRLTPVLRQLLPCGTRRAPEDGASSIGS